jgi:hypothetical protein
MVTIEQRLAGDRPCNLVRRCLLSLAGRMQANLLLSNDFW